MLDSCLLKIFSIWFNSKLMILESFEFLTPKACEYIICLTVINAKEKSKAEWWEMGMLTAVAFLYKMFKEGLSEEITFGQRSLVANLWEEYFRQREYRVQNPLCRRVLGLLNKWRGESVSVAKWLQETCGPTCMWGIRLQRHLWGPCLLFCVIWERLWVFLNRHEKTWLHI